DGLSGIVGGLFVHADDEIGVGAIVIGRRVFRGERDGARQVAHCGMIALELLMILATSVERHGALRHELDRLAVVLESRLVLAKCSVGIAAIVMGGAVVRRE